MLSEEDRDTTVDWPALAGGVLRRLDRPALILDAAGTIRGVNGLLARLVERPEHDLLGRPWDAVAAAPETAQLRVEGGHPPRIDARFPLVPEGEVVALVDVATLGPGSLGWTLLQVAHARRTRPTAGWGAAPVGYAYTVRSVGDGRGELLGVEGEGLDAEDLLGDLCFRGLHGRDRPCAACPVFEGKGAGVRAFPPSGAGGAFRVVEVHRDSHDGVATVEAHFVDAKVLSTLLEARIEVLARDAGLATRERDVLGLLCLGRGASELAMLLQVSERTAKYQQSSVLRKVGVDSRAELVRLLLGRGALRIEPGGGR